MIRLSFKHTVILISLLFIATILFILFSKDINKTISDNEKEKVLKQYNEQQEIVLSDSSTSDMLIDIPEDSKIVSTLEFDKEQIYFKEAEILYEYYSFDEVNKIKYKVQNFIHNYIDKNILDCSIDRNSIINSDSNISFNIMLENNNVLIIETLKNENNFTVNIQYN